MLGKRWRKLRCTSAERRRRHDHRSGELTESYSSPKQQRVKMTKSELINLIEEAGFEAVERDTFTIVWLRCRSSLILTTSVEGILNRFALLSSVGVATAQDPPPTLARDHCSVP